ncbi:MAG: peptide chain release factor N(5)-glutamine methyltransferase [Bacillota bacterium]|nr:peptide chain release factor N(5)-glutamine methyltransferase [Bacillota bacterium]
MTLTMAKQYTIGELISLSAGYLESKGCSSARLDAELLLGHVLGLDRLDLYLNFDKPLSSREVDEYRQYIGRRGQRVPLAYLTGQREFYSLPIHVSPDVLIPRPETEFVVDKTLEVLEAGQPANILELGTGSGAIALALACQDPLFRITAVDVSQEALKVAEANAKRLEVDSQVVFLQSDLFENVTGTYRVICSNPPYIKRDELPRLSPEVQTEPALALDGGPDGLEFYRRILGQAASLLEQPGFVVLEIGWDQGPDVRAIGEKSGFTWLETARDYSGKDRVVVFQWA